MPDVFDSILITGGRGMLAQALDRVLRQRGDVPALVGRGDCDVSDAAQVADLFERIKPTLVLNCAAYTKVDLAEQESEQSDRVNGYAPGVLAEACARHCAKLVHFSTDYVFDGTLRRPMRPEDPTGPVSAY